MNKIAILVLLFSINTLAKKIGDQNYIVSPYAKVLSSESIDDAKFEGIVALSGCSGSLIVFKGQSVDDKAMILTNDHCIYDQKPKNYILDQPYKKTIAIYDRHRKKVSQRTTRIIYAEQTDSDFAILELGISYQELFNKHDIVPFTLSNKKGQIDDKISIISGYWNKIYSCSIESFAFRLKESLWVWKESYRYDCGTIGGTSGSPILLENTREVIGINNTSNERGQKCTLNNPCEIDPSGKISIHQGKGYGQQTKYIYSCLDEKSRFDLSTNGCLLYGGDSWQER